MLGGVALQGAPGILGMYVWEVRNALSTVISVTLGCVTVSRHSKPSIAGTWASWCLTLVKIRLISPVKLALCCALLNPACV